MQGQMEIDFIEAAKRNNFNLEQARNEQEINIGRKDTINERLGDRERLRNLFLLKPNELISLPEIMRLGGAQYGTRILELRRDKKSPMYIENVYLGRGDDGRKHTAFRYIPKG